MAGQGKGALQMGKKRLTLPLSFPFPFYPTKLDRTSEMRELTALAMRALYAFGSFHYIKVNGECASPREAPLVVVGPHYSLFDSIVVAFCGPSTVVAKSKAADLPLIGSKSRHVRPRRRRIRACITFDCRLPCRDHRHHAADLCVPGGSELAAPNAPPHRRARHLEGGLAADPDLPGGYVQQRAGGGAV